MAKISEHFDWNEVLVSDSYPTIVKQIKLTEEQRRNCFLLAHLALEPIRQKFGPTKITSWVRDEDLNYALGGSRTSQHLTGEACDFICLNVRNMREVFEFIGRELKWPGQVIFYEARGHIHIALPREGTRQFHRIQS